MKTWRDYVGLQQAEAFERFASSRKPLDPDVAAMILRGREWPVTIKSSRLCNGRLDPLDCGKKRTWKEGEERSFGRLYAIERHLVLFWPDLEPDANGKQALVPANAAGFLERTAEGFRSTPVAPEKGRYELRLVAWAEGNPLRAGSPVLRIAGPLDAPPPLDLSLSPSRWTELAAWLDHWLPDEETERWETYLGSLERRVLDGEITAAQRKALLSFWNACETRIPRLRKPTAGRTEEIGGTCSLTWNDADRPGLEARLEIAPDGRFGWNFVDGEQAAGTESDPTPQATPDTLLAFLERFAKSGT